MTTLYIANTTKQDHDFSFRRPEANFPTVIKIPAGTQALIIKDGDTDFIDRVLDHHRKYGLKSVAEASKAKVFVGMVYSTDKPVRFKDMKVVFERNDEVLEKQGVEQVKAVAAAVNATIDEKLQTAGVKTDASHVEVEVVEENAPGQKTTLAVGAEVVKKNKKARRAE